MVSARTQAVLLWKNGFNIVPIGEGKAPTKGTDLTYLHRNRIKKKEIQTEVGSKLGIIAGDTSDNLIVLDFDSKDFKHATAKIVFMKFNKKIKALKKRYNFPVETTPSGGYHFYFRSTEPVGSKENLAYDYVVNKKGKVKRLSNGTKVKRAVIEKMANGNYVVADPTPGYKLNGTAIVDTPVLKPEEVDFILSICRTFNHVKTKKITEDSLYTGPVLTDTQTEEAEKKMFNILFHQGWKLIRKDKENEHYERPDQEEEGKIGASWNGTVFYIHSTSVSPLEAGQGYLPLQVVAELLYNGDVTSAKINENWTNKPKPLPDEFHKRTPVENSETKTKPKLSKEDQKKKNKKDKGIIAQLVQKSESIKSNAWKNEEQDPFMYFRDYGLFHTGTINIIHGQTGQHKSRIGGLVASTILDTKHKYKPDNYDPTRNLGLQFNTNKYDPKDFLVVYFDTERNSVETKEGKIVGQFNTAVMEIYHFAGLKRGAKCNFLPVTDDILDPKQDMSDEEKVDTIMTVTRKLAEKQKKHVVCIIDNMADLISENNQDEVKETLKMMNSSATKDNITLILTMHENPLRNKSEEEYRKMVGWLGSVGSRKASITLGIRELKAKGNRPIDDHPSTRVFEIATSKTRQVGMFRGIFVKTFVVPADEADNPEQKLVGLCPPSRDEIKEYEAPNTKEEKLDVADTFLAVVQNQDQQRKAGMKKEYSVKDTLKELVEKSGVSYRTVGKKVEEIMMNQSSYYGKVKIYKEKVIGKKNGKRFTTIKITKKSKSAK